MRVLRVGVVGKVVDVVGGEEKDGERYEARLEFK